VAEKAARSIFRFVGLVGIAFGCIYLFRGSLMPFHATFIARTGAIQSGNAELLLVMMMHVVGSLFLSLSATIIALTCFYWRAPGTRFLVGALSLASLVPVQLASWRVGNRAGVIETVLVLAVVAVILSVPATRSSSSRLLPT